MQKMHMLKHQLDHLSIRERMRNGSYKIQRYISITRANYQPGVDRDPPRRNLPAAPPPRMPPPPPPPPGLPETLDINVSKRGLFAIMLGGSLLWYTSIQAGVPVAKVDKQRGIALLKTKKGNSVIAAADEQGRLFMFDKAGNIYYDTEDSRLGVYIVDTGGDMYNEFVDADGKVQQTYVGNLADLRSLKVKEIGGVNITDLQKSVQGFKGGRIIGFPKQVDPNNPSWSDVLPPNAPAVMNKNGTKVEPPQFLEDLELELEPTGLFGAPRNVDIVETLKSLRSK